MTAFIAKRLGLAFLVAIAVSLIAFFLLRISGDPALAIAGEGASQADLDLIRRTYGFDRPLPVQYLDWLWRTLRGEFGDSIYFKTAAGPLIFSKLQTTLVLGFAALLCALLISIPLGVLAAIYKDSWIDRVCLGLAVVGQALPNFFFALLLIMLNAAGVVSGATLWSRWREVFLGTWIFAAVATPTGDIFNLSLLAVPILGLIFIAMGLASLNDRRRRRGRPAYDEWDDDETSPLDETPSTLDPTPSDLSESSD